MLKEEILFNYILSHYTATELSNIKFHKYLMGYINQLSHHIVHSSVHLQAFAASYFFLKDKADSSQIFALQTMLARNASICSLCA